MKEERLHKDDTVIEMGNLSKYKVCHKIAGFWAELHQCVEADAAPRIFLLSTVSRKNSQVVASLSLAL